MHSPRPISHASCCSPLSRRWRQLFSYTPVGKLALKRLIYRTDGATYSDVREAIASHRSAEGGNDIVTLVLERTLGTEPDEAAAADEPAPVPTLEPLSEVLRRDLQRGREDERSVDRQLDSLAPGERARRLFGIDDDVE